MILNDGDRAVLDRLFVGELSQEDADAMGLVSMRGVSFLGDDTETAVKVLLDSVVWNGLDGRGPIAWSLQVGDPISTLSVLGLKKALAA